MREQSSATPDPKKGLLMLLAYVGVVVAVILAVQALDAWTHPAAPTPIRPTVIQQAPQTQPQPVMIDPNGRSPGAIDPNGNGRVIEPTGH